MEKVLRLGLAYRLRIFAPLLLSLIVLESISQTGYHVSAVKVSEIKKIDQCDLPEEMVYRIKNMLPEQMRKFKEEYQQTITDENGEQIVKTINLRFFDDHIIGFIKTAPLNRTDNAILSNTQIKVPLQWGCTPQLGHSKQHTAYYFAEMNEFNGTENCVGWHQMKEGEHLLPPLPKAKRKKFLGLF